MQARALVLLLCTTAWTQELPAGSGLAASYPHDREISEHPAVIFADGFEASDAWEERWDSVRDDGGVLARVAPEGQAWLGAGCLQVTATLGENTGGGLTQWFASAPRLFIRFYTRFAEDCDYVHHFVTLRANASLQGSERWSGFGGAGLRPDGALRFSTALEPWGDWGRETPPGVWNFYSYFHTMKESGDGNFWGNSFRPPEQAAIARGTWICCELMLVHNTPGVADGEQAFWIDGELRGHFTGINWRTSPTLWANALTLEAYVTDRWTEQRVNVIAFDNVVIAREYIGPTEP